MSKLSLILHADPAIPVQFCSNPPRNRPKTVKTMKPGISHSENEKAGQDLDRVKTVKTVKRGKPVKGMAGLVRISKTGKTG